MNNQEFKKYKLPDKPGVYFFVKNKSSARSVLAERILYIGKATSLRDRVRSYFGKDLINTRGPAILDMIVQADSVEWQETDSVLEALILEANLIKKYQPKYNTKEKDNKSFNYVCITNPSQPPLIRGGGIQSHPDKGDLGGLPRVLIIRGRNIEKEKYQNIFGPFPNGSQLKEAMKIVRRIFPFIDNDSIKKNNREFYKQLGLVPFINITLQKNSFQKVLGRGGREPVPDHFEKHFSASLHEYKNNIKNLKLFFQGKKKNVISNLKKEMMRYAKEKEFEKAEEIKKRIFALNHINDVALIKEEDILLSDTHFFRIEAYDIAHMSGKNMVGVMTVVEDGEVKKSEYKKFIIKTQSGANDTGALEEVLSRRLLHHVEWGIPNIIVVDGGKAQINVAKRVINRYQFLDIPIVSVLKDERHKAKAVIGDEKIIKKYQKEILLANSESHRFAIAFHKQKRNKSFL